MVAMVGYRTCCLLEKCESFVFFFLSCHATVSNDKMQQPLLLLQAAVPYLLTAVVL